MRGGAAGRAATVWFVVNLASQGRFQVREGRGAFRHADAYLDENARGIGGQKKLVTLQRKPPEQFKEYVPAHFGEFLKRVHDARELHMAELFFLVWRLKKGRLTVECAAGLVPPRRCRPFTVNLLGSFRFHRMN